MRIAVTHENGEVFGHFGHTERFKLYDAEDGTIDARCDHHERHEGDCGRDHCAGN